MSREIKFNVNHNIKVVLTDLGRTKLKQRHDDLMSNIPESARWEYTPPKEDSNGWSSWQMHVLMNELGQFMSMGSDLPFKTEIIIKLEN